MKRLMVFTSLLTLVAGCAINNGNYGATGIARTFENGYVVNNEPKGKEAAANTGL